MTSVESRLSKLEHANRMWRYLSVAAVLGLIAAISLGQGAAVPPVVRAQGFELCTPDGQRVAFLGPSADRKTAGLFLYDNHRHVRAALTGTADGPADLRFITADGKEIARLGFSRQWAGASFDDQDNRTRVFIGTKDHGPAMMIMRGPDNKNHVGVWIDGDGGYIRLDDKDGNARFTVPSTRPTSQPESFD